MIDRRFCVAPMMKRTDRHCRYLLRLISRRAVLYTEMVTTGALIHGDRARFLAFDASEHPVALQLGGSESGHMATCARMAEETGYDEVNINAGCPSDRAQSGRFGACLMAEPERVADCVAAMRAAVSIPVTVKTRIGIDELDSYETLARFVETVAAAGCSTFVLHARKAWLKGLSPRENRELPPLRYDRVYRLKRQFAQLEIVLNGGLGEPAEAHTHLAHLDGVMLGREVYRNPYLLAQVDRLFYNDPRTPLTREAVLEAYLPYIQQQIEAGVYLGAVTQHLIGLFQDQPGARAFRRHLSENAYRPGAGIEVVCEAAQRVGGRCANAA